MIELTSEERMHMHKLALAMLPKAYAPYSKFQVGASLRTAAGGYYSGCNIENASYSLVQCAEACAIANMVSAGEKDIVAAVIVSSGNLICSPCGACRQRFREFSLNDMWVYMYDRQGHFLTKKLSDLLPLSFGPSNLDVELNTLFTGTEG